MYACMYVCVYLYILSLFTQIKLYFFIQFKTEINHDTSFYSSKKLGASSKHISSLYNFKMLVVK